jgi:hypothetical protein
VGCYIPPNNLSTLATIEQAWNKCPRGHTPILIGDLNVNLHSPRDERDKQIAEVVEDVICPVTPLVILWFHTGKMDVADEKRQEVGVLPM